MLLTDDNQAHFPLEVADDDLQAPIDHDSEKVGGDPTEIANQAKPLALKWIDNAILVLNACVHSFEPGSAPTIQAKLGLPIVRRHFHTDKAISGVTEKDSLRRIETNYQTIRRYLCNSEHIFHSADDETASRDTLGYFQPNGPLVGGYTFPMKSISFTAHYPTLGPNCKASVIIHLIALYIDARMNHTGGDSGPVYDRSDLETSVFNVFCYQNFAIHATPPFVDERYGMNRPSI